MIGLNDLKKLDVGDIAAYERSVKENRRKELIALTKELHGENIPSDAVMEIDRELKKIPSIFSEDGADIDAEAVQFLVWRSMLKTDPDATLEQAGKMFNVSNMQDYVSKILPEPDSLPPQKKTAKKVKRKKKPKDN
jgi:hypothetical protein